MLYANHTKHFDFKIHNKRTQVSILHWQSHITSRLGDHPHQLATTRSLLHTPYTSCTARLAEHVMTILTTRRVLELMAVGQFLPPQLALVPQVPPTPDPSPCLEESPPAGSAPR